MVGDPPVPVGWARHDAIRVADSGFVEGALTSLRCSRLLDDHGRGGDNRRSL